MASLVPFLKKKLGDVAQGVQHEVASIGRGVVNQVNPYDNNRTFQQRAPTNNRSVIGQMTHNGLTNLEGNMVAKPIARTFAIPVESARVTAAQISRNKPAEMAAQHRLDFNSENSMPAIIANQFINAGRLAKATPDAVKADIRGFRGQAPTPQQQQSLNKGLQAYNNTVPGQLMRVNQGIVTNLIPGAKDSLHAAGVQDQNLQHQLADVGIGVAGALGTKGSIEGAVKGGKAIHTEVKAANAAKATLAEYDNTLANLHNQKASLQKRIDTTPNFRGAETTQLHMDQLDRHIADVTANRPKMTLKEKLLAPNIGLSMKAVHSPELHPDQNQFIEDYASILKQTGEGNGVSIHPDGRRISNNVRDAADKGKALTNADYFDKARREIESGKAPYGLSDHYKELTAGLDHSPIEAPAEFGGAPTAPSVPATTPKPQLSSVARAVPGKPASKPQLLKSEVSSPTSVPNSLTKGAKDERQGLAPEVVVGTKGAHDVRNTAKLGKSASVDIAKMDDQTAIQTAHDRLNVDLGKIDDKDVAFTNEAIQRAQDAGRMEDAINLHDKLSEHLVKTGQTAQAASLLYRLSPDGIFYKAVRDLKKGGTEVTPELQTKLKEQSDAIKTATGTEAKQRATARLGKTVADNIPKGKMNDLLSIWKAGLLSGVKTQQGNAISNGMFGALKKVSDIPSAGVDKGLSLITGKRTKVATLRGAGSGGVEGLQKGFGGTANAVARKLHLTDKVSKNQGTLVTGIDERNITGTKYEQHAELNFKNPVIQKVFGDTSNLVFRGMSAADQPFYYAAAKNNLYDLALSEAKNRKLGGIEKSKFVQNFVDNPPAHAAQRAKDAADKAVLGYDTVVSKGLTAFHTAIDKAPISPAAKGAWHATIGVLAPFVKVPSAFISRTIDFTPAGPLKEAVNQISNKKFDQRALSEAVGQGMTGTGVIALGIALAQSDLLSGNYPKNDPKEAQRWKTEQITPNSVRLYTGKDAQGKDKHTWVSLNYMGPLGLLFNAGKQFHDAKDGSALGKVAASVGGLGQGLLGQSFLQGFSGFSDAINDPQRNAKSFANSQASSVVPAWVNDIANVTDKFQRQADTTAQAVKNRLPGLREGNKVKQDVYGNGLKQPAGQLNTLNGIKPSNSLTDSQASIAEVGRLHKVNPDDSNLQVTPQPIGKTITVEKKQIPLTDTQRYDLQKKVGQATQDNWNKLIQTPEYKALDDSGKAKALTNLKTDASTLATRQYVIDNKLGTYEKAPTKTIQNLGSGSDVTSYTQPSTKASTGIPTMPKNPHPMPKTINTTYDPTSKTWTQKSSLTGRTTVISADGTRTVTNEGTKKPRTTTKTITRNGATIITTGTKTSRTGTTRTAKTPKMHVASLASLSSHMPKVPRVKTPKVHMASLKTKRAVYRSSKIASNANAKLRLKIA
jgi:hypothetical protein